MKILVFASSAFPRWKGDPQPGFVYDLSRKMAKKGDEVIVLVPHSPGAVLCESMEGMTVRRFRYFFPSSLERLCYGGGILPNIRKSILARIQLPFLVLSEFIALLSVGVDERPDLIHAHWILPQGFVASFVGMILAIPVVVTAHAGDVFPLNKPVYRVLSRFSITHSAAVTVNSDFTRVAVEKIGGKIPKVIPMGVDLKLFSSTSGSAISGVRERYHIGKKDRMVLFVGRLAEKKGVTYLIEAMKLVAKRYPQSKLVIVGDGPERVALHKQSLNLRDNVVFAGSVHNDQLPALYKAADVFVLPSIVAKNGDTEGLGVVMLEAIAAGTPVVASNVGGIPDVIIDTKTGILVEQKNPQQLASAISALLSNQKLRKNLVVAARKHISEKFSWDLVSREFSELYKSVKK
jgi:glycosyltransferase involved in cell wall biosynthesis